MSISTLIMELSAEQQAKLLDILRTRFEKNRHRHERVSWIDVQRKLESQAQKLWSLSEMERTGGEPDVVTDNTESTEFVFYDCSTETPNGRRNLCYDRVALNARKEFKPKDSAMDVAAAMGIEILTEEQYYRLQQLGKFDTKTSSWIKTPEAIRKHGGAIFCDRRYEHVFTYHNGAQSYYAVRGFRGLLRV